MRTCADLELYLDRRLPPDAAAGFVAHLGGCPACAEAVDRWRAAERDLGDAAASPPLPPPSPIEVRRLVERAAADRARPTRAWIAAAAAAVAIGAAAAIAFHGTGRETARPAEAPAVEATVLTGSGSRSVGQEELAKSGLSVPISGRARLQIGDDAIDVSSGSKLRLVQSTAEITRVRLDAGKVTCSVARRGLGREFQVEAGSYLVRVTGTRFSVAIAGRRGLGVRVESGEVEVSSNGELLRRLAAGERLDIPDEEPSAVARPAAGEAAPDALPESAAAPRGGRSAATPGAGPDLETLRAWIVGGQYADAESELRAKLDWLPTDVEARSLLADCLRKQGRWSEAAEVYREVAATGYPVLSRRASSILRDILADHPGVAEGKALPAQ